MNDTRHPVFGDDKGETNSLGGDRARGHLPQSLNKGRRPIPLVAGLAVLVILLAGAAYAGGSLLSRPAATQPATGRGGIVPGPGGQIYKVHILPAKEIPEAPPEIAGGAMVRRHDNSLFLGTGRISISISRSSPETPGATDTNTVRTSLLYDGPVVEVVVTRDTKIYRDATELNAPSAAQSKGALGDPVQQVVRPATLDEIVENCELMVWGEKHGDRTVASVISFSRF